MPNIINWNLRGQQPDDELTFREIWSNLALRTTTKREDLHGIMAVMTGLSAWGVFSVRDGGMPSPERRMVAILRAQKSLPLSMLYMPHSDETPLCKGYPWVPQFPSGYPFFSAGSMTWESDGPSLVIVPTHTSKILILEPTRVYQGENIFFISMKVPPGEAVRTPSTSGLSCSDHINIYSTPNRNRMAKNIVCSQMDMLENRLGLEHISYCATKAVASFIFRSYPQSLIGLPKSQTQYLERKLCQSTDHIRRPQIQSVFFSLVLTAYITVAVSVAVSVIFTVVS